MGNEECELRKAEIRDQRFATANPSIGGSEVRKEKHKWREDRSLPAAAGIVLRIMGRDRAHPSNDEMEGRPQCRPIIIPIITSEAPHEVKSNLTEGSEVNEGGQ